MGYRVAVIAGAKRLCVVLPAICAIVGCGHGTSPRQTGQPSEPGQPELAVSGGQDQPSLSHGDHTIDERLEYSRALIAAYPESVSEHTKTWVADGGRYLGENPNVKWQRYRAYIDSLGFEAPWQGAQHIFEQDVRQALSESRPEAYKIFYEPGMPWRMAMDLQRGIAMELLDQGIEQDSSAVIAYRLRADLHESIGQMSQAFADLDLAIELRPDEPVSYVSRGRMLTRYEDRRQEAIADLTHALALGRDTPYVHYLLGLAYQHVGGSEGLATTHLTKALQGEEIPNFRHRLITRMLSDPGWAAEVWHK
ncbi:hypothetical protein HN371_06255 [Candidatus Poribacteria bacterium]|mgnify:FL=1|jgi:tetratricopeptide (TPR) repeat protein|nr:hypothetical protein [Candidatus Poribacteria bacterium]MBT5534063.1 hypothetical protein [Candidatus Poribacteria bacterium]MBT5713751.1 hypothetical protein [Candidatus Poribacteria bacterium]MBT7098045.1 hypothetical protein [Candidatus Poribacteria bacterium]MBT7807624.1 hypothetical protein [Candidatus Poribacteria bacterium]